MTPRELVSGWLPPAIWSALRGVASMAGMAKRAGFRDPTELELERLRSLPRYSATTARLLGREFRVPDPTSAASIYSCYFLRQEYRFVTGRSNPLIIDCGANVGIGIHYWKSLCPDARIIAFEPDPDSFQALVENCGYLGGVELRNEAVWTEAGSLRFAAVGADGGHLSAVAQRDESVNEIQVRSARLREFLVEPVELLKLDIEGAEVDVLLDCALHLRNVRRIFVEFHPFIGRPQRLGALIQVIEDAGFRIHAHPEMPAPQPFIERPVYNGKDFRLNLYCMRD